MTHPVKALLAAAIAFALPAAAWSQDSNSGYHPMLSSTFSLNVGAFFPSEGLKLSADASTGEPGEEVDFEKAFNVDESDTTPSGELRWRFGEKWSVWGQYFDSNVGGGRVLQEDITWRDLTLQAGSNAHADVDTKVARVFFGRVFAQGPGYEFGAGAGFHWMDLAASVEGEVLVNESEFEIRRREADVSAPLPNIGAWYIYSPSSRWAIHARLDWLSASIDEFSGSLWNVGAGVNYQVLPHMGIGLSYNYFQIDVDVDADDWHGGAEIEQHGPFASVSFNW